MNAMENKGFPFDSSLPYGAPMFDMIYVEDYPEAFRLAISEGKSAKEKIATCAEAPTFENTIVALEYAGSKLDTLSGIFYNLLEADSTPRLQEIAEEVAPLMTEYNIADKRIFARVKAVYDKRHDLGLTPVQIRLTEQHYRSMMRHGAGLEGEQKAEYESCEAELSVLALKFGANVLSATNSYELHITRDKDVEGFPDYLLEAAATTAREKCKDGWVFTLDRPSYGPFMQYCRNSVLRHKMYMAFATRAVGGEYDNTSIIRRIVSLRRKIASLLGYDSWSDYVLAENMAHDTDTVNRFLSGLTSATMPYAKDEIDGLLVFASARGYREPVMQPWDLPFWAERMREKRFTLSQEKLKPYFRLENCVDAVFSLATRLYGITFDELHDLPVYHPDVKVYDVKDTDGTHLALLYTDFFPRPSKRGGAWMTEFFEQRVENGTDKRPAVSIVMNFTKPTPTKPSLLTHDELTTLLHEFGHALHGIFSKGIYPSMTGTNVARDFVELPSQIMENWGFEKEFLHGFAKDYRTGEVIPDSLVDSIVASKNYLSGYYQLRQLDFGIIDMAWHGNDELSSNERVEDYEARVLRPYKVLPYVPGTCTSASFGHIFSGGYSAGYYSYKWAEVLEADAFSLFEQNGIFNRQTATSFRDNILSKGDSEDPAVLFRRFRGRDADPRELMKKLGLA